MFEQKNIFHLNLTKNRRQDFSNIRPERCKFTGTNANKYWIGFYRYVCCYNDNVSFPIFMFDFKMELLFCNKGNLI